MQDDVKTVEYGSPSGGWGSLIGIAKVLLREKPSPAVFETLARQNKAHGHMCTSCAWGKPKHPHPFEFCENGAKATMWELTSDRCTPDFFATHTVTELRGWDDFDLEMEGRLTHPMRYDPRTDKYVPTSWDEAFAAIGAELRALDPKSTVFYASGRAGLEASYLYALYARMYGHNNLPDSSNMCHETTSVGLKKVIGSPVGTCVLDDFEHCDAIFYFGQNPGTNSPRFLHPLQDAVRRGCKIVTFNPVREKGLIEFVDPQNPLQMATHHPTKLSHMYLQVRPGGDIAALMGLARHVFVVDAERRAAGERPVLDDAFIAAHCSGFEAFRDQALATGLGRDRAATRALRAPTSKRLPTSTSRRRTPSPSTAWASRSTSTARRASACSSTCSCYAATSAAKGPACRRSAGIPTCRDSEPSASPKSRHSCRSTGSPSCSTSSRRARPGRTTVDVCEGILDGSVKAFVGLGGNFVRAIPGPGPDGTRVDADGIDGTDRDEAQSQPPRQRQEGPGCCPASRAPRKTCRRAGRNRSRWRTASATCTARSASAVPRANT